MTVTVRCLNCLERIPVETGTERALCQKCKLTYIIAWPSADQAKIKSIAS